MRTQLLIAAVVFAFSTAAQTTNAELLPPYGWTSGLYAQGTDAAVMLFPNPASDAVNITFPGLRGSVIVSIVASDGRVMLQQQVGQAFSERLYMNTSDLADGVYLVRVRSENKGEISRQLIVSKNSGGDDIR